MNAKDAAQWRWNHVAKPLHSLGKLEELIIQIAEIQQTPNVGIDQRCALVFCADHGVVEEGVSQSGSDVTALVAKSIVEGNANISLMAQTAHTDVFGVDMGMLFDVPGMIDRKIARGTRNMARFSAMSRAQAEQALMSGVDLVGDMKKRGYRIILTGEMGIGNTTASSAIACALLGIPPELATGRGAGLSDEGLKRKIQTIQRAFALNRPDASDPMDVLAKVGGFEIIGMTGAFLGGMKHRIPVVIDGVISAVAALAAVRICPEARAFMLPSHMSREPVALHVMRELQMQPVIHADMALGEGTGAAALLPLLDMALSIYNSSHTFEHLGMAAYEPQEDGR